MSELPETTIAQLAEAQWETLPSHFRLHTPQGDLAFEQCLRFLPGKRLAGKARWQGQTVFAKLFFTHLERARKESDTLAKLIQRGIPTPAPQPLIELDGAALLITQWLDAIPAKDLPLNMLLPRLTSLVLQLSAAGFCQPDLHFDNFLWDNQQLWLIDAGEIRSVPRKKQHKQLADSFSILCTQIPLAQRMSSRKLIELRLSKHSRTPVRLTSLVEEKHHRHVERMMKKWQRECSAIKLIKEPHLCWHIDRQLSPATEQQLVHAATHLSEMEQIKQGGKVAVYRHPDGWIIKHYHQANWRTRAKANVFRGRADISWVMGWTLAELGIPTPKPVLLWRHKNGQQLLVFPLVEGPPLAHAIEAGADCCAPPARRATFWLNLMHLYGFWHGDTKAYNALIDSKGEVHWIDLDAAGYSNNRARLARKISTDNERFEKNWTQRQEPPPYPV